MAKIPFDIKYRPQIESGEYKVETRDGKPVKLMSINSYNTRPIIGAVELNGKNVYISTDENGSWTEGNGENKFDLFIVTPEEELTEWEKEVRRFSAACARRPNYVPSDGDIRNWASELLAIAKKQLDTEILKDRAVELTKHLNESGLDENSIEYNLIEFMCNLMDCPNWSEIVETAGLYAGRIKAEATKDFPRWQKWGNGACGNGIGIPLAIVKRGFNGYKLVDALGIPGEQYIMLSDLEKLSGFKEDRV